MRRSSRNLSLVTDEILSEVASVERVKHAEISALHAVTPSHHTEVGQLLHKAAEELRAEPEVSYDDVRQFMAGRL